MPKLTKLEKVGYVTLMSAPSKIPGQRADYWLRWRDPATCKDLKERLLDVATRDDARIKARERNQDVTEERAELRTKPASAVHHIRNAPTLKQCMDEALTVKNKRKPFAPAHKKNLEKLRDKFLTFMADRFPTVVHWLDLRRVPHVQAYVDAMVEDGLKATSIRHALEVISLTSNYMADEYDEVYKPLRVLKIAPQREEPVKKYLSIAQLEKAIETAAERKSDRALLAFYLGGYAGLNLFEIVRLRQADFDFKAGTVAVGETGAKNKYRRRCIPLPSFVVEYVKEYIRTQSVVDVAGLLIVPPDGVEQTPRLLSKPVETVFKYAGLKGVCCAKDLRKSFINLARGANVEREILRRYVGHSASDMMSDSYEEFKARFQTQVVVPVEVCRDKFRNEVGTKLESAEVSEAAIAR